MSGVCSIYFTQEKQTKARKHSHCSASGRARPLRLSSAIAFDLTSPHFTATGRRSSQVGLSQVGAQIEDDAREVVSALLKVLLALCSRRLAEPRREATQAQAAELPLLKEPCLPHLRSGGEARERSCLSLSSIVVNASREGPNGASPPQ